MIICGKKEKKKKAIARGVREHGNYKFTSVQFDKKR